MWMAPNRIPKVALHNHWTPPGKRKRGRSRTTWSRTQFSRTMFISKHLLIKRYLLWGLRPHTCYWSSCTKIGKWTVMYLCAKCIDFAYETICGHLPLSFVTYWLIEKPISSRSDVIVLLHVVLDLPLLMTYDGCQVIARAQMSFGLVS
jgi:hypothetical protein